LHRIGQQGTVTIVHLGAKGTVDEQIALALAAKQNMADLLTGDGARRLAAEVLR
jgi:SNF2 family DNA or RNA helicase